MFLIAMLIQDGCLGFSVQIRILVERRIHSRFLTLLQDGTTTNKHGELFVAFLLLSPLSTPFLAFEM